MMLTSSQWPGVLRFVSKHRTYVFVLTISYTLLSVFVTVFSHPLEKYFPMTPPPPPQPSEITAFESPLPLGISNDLLGGGGGGYGYFLEPHIRFCNILFASLFHQQT